MDPTRAWWAGGWLAGWMDVWNGWMHEWMGVDGWMMSFYILLYYTVACK